MRRGMTWLVPFTALITLAGLIVLAPAARAALASTASLKPRVQYLNDATGTTLTFTVNNTSSLSESLGSVRIKVPGIQWIISSCPGAPTGWTKVASTSACTYDSASGTSDN